MTHSSITIGRFVLMLLPKNSPLRFTILEEHKSMEKEQEAIINSIWANRKSNGGLTYSLNILGEYFMKHKNFKYYVVITGKVPGIYASWKEVIPQITGFKVPLFKGFNNLSEAHEFIRENYGPSYFVSPNVYTSPPLSNPSYASCVSCEDLKRYIVNLQLENKRLIDQIQERNSYISSMQTAYQLLTNRLIQLTPSLPPQPSQEPNKEKETIKEVMYQPSPQQNFNPEEYQRNIYQMVREVLRNNAILLSPSERNSPTRNSTDRNPYEDNDHEEDTPENSPADFILEARNRQTAEIGSPMRRYLEEERASIIEWNREAARRRELLEERERRNQASTSTAPPPP